MSEERKHHACSPSSLQFVEACPSFKNHGEVHAAAIVGTLQHAATETGQDDASLTDDQAGHVAFCIDFAERREQLMQEERIRAMSSVPVLSLKEQFLAVDDIAREFPGIGNESCTTGGYVDQIIISSNRKKAELLDWKYGKWRVSEAKTNLQGAAYCLGLFRAYPTLENITVFFVQPAIEYVTSHIFNRTDIPEMYLRISTVVERRIDALKKNDFSSAKPSTMACLFCARKAECPKLTDFALQVGRKFSPLEVPEDLTPTLLLDPKQSSIGMKLAQIVSVWAEAFKRRTTDRVLCEGAEPPTGYKLAEGTSRRSVADPEKFKQVALKHLTEAELAGIASYGLTDAESLVNLKAPRGHKSAAVSEFRKNLVDTGAVVPGQKFVYLKVTDEDV